MIAQAPGTRPTLGSSLEEVDAFHVQRMIEMQPSPALDRGRTVTADQVEATMQDGRFAEFYEQPIQMVGS